MKVAFVANFNYSAFVCEIGKLVSFAQHKGKKTSTYLFCSVPLPLSTRTRCQIPSPSDFCKIRCLLFRIPRADYPSIGDITHNPTGKK